MQQEEAAERQRLARQLLGSYDIRTQPNSFHVWLELPEPWTSDEFANLARANGVIVVSGSQFLAQRSASTRGVRIALMGPSRAELGVCVDQAGQPAGGAGAAVVLLIVVGAVSGRHEGDA